jgi:hypothetical protein
MMCIDGVVEGFYRCSLGGYDLNRVWDDPSPTEHPVVYHVKELMREISARQKIDAYIDLHGHSFQHGTFAFGCPNSDQPELRNSEKILPRMLSILSDAFSWPKCVFSYPDVRKSASRIVVRREMNVVHAFTIETSFGGIISGPMAGTLNDERIWRDFGAKVAEGLYHLLGKDVSPLRTFALADLARGPSVPRLQNSPKEGHNKTKADIPVKKQAIVVRKSVLPKVIRLKIAT